MVVPSSLDDASDRGDALRRLGLRPEARFDRITRLAQRLLAVPVARLVLIDDTGEWFVSHQGLALEPVVGAPSLCGDVLCREGVLHSADAREDPALAAHPWVRAAPHLRMYAARALYEVDGAAAGVLCVMDTRVRHLSRAALSLLDDLAVWAEHELNVVHLHRVVAELETTRDALARSRRDLERSNEELRRLVLQDGLTGIANRRRFEERLQSEWRRAARTGRPLSLALFDIDHFKAYNDRYGHLAGDALLARVAHEIAPLARRPADLAARYGGEEFVLLLPDTALDAAVTRARIARRQVARTETGAADGAAVSVSGGVASLVPARETDLHALIALADKALYRAKAHGRNRIEYAGHTTKPS